MKTGYFSRAISSDVNGEGVGTRGYVADKVITRVSRQELNWFCCLTNIVESKYFKTDSLDELSFLVL